MNRFKNLIIVFSLLISSQSFSQEAKFSPGAKIGVGVGGLVTGVGLTVAGFVVFDDAWGGGASFDFDSAGYVTWAGIIVGAAGAVAVVWGIAEYSMMDSSQQARLKKEHKMLNNIAKLNIKSGLEPSEQGFLALANEVDCHECSDRERIHAFSELVLDTTAAVEAKNINLALEGVESSENQQLVKALYNFGNNL